MIKFHPLYILPLVCFCIVGFSFYQLNILGNGIIDDLHTPFDIEVLGDRDNHDLTCFKVGLYTDWDEGWFDPFFDFVSGVYVGEHARQMFFEYNCGCHDSTHGINNWRSDKMCLRELYPHD